MSLLQLFRNIPFVRFAFFLGVGIFFAEYLEKSDLQVTLLVFGIVFILMILSLFAPFVFQKYTHRWLSGALFFIFLAMLGMVLSLSSRANKFEGTQDIVAKARVVEGDITLSGYYLFEVEPLEYSAKEPLLPGSDDLWQIIVEPEDSLSVLPASPGNIVAFKTRLSGHSPNTNPEAFDYGRYLFRKGVSATGFVSLKDFQVVRKSSMTGIKGAIKRMRGKVYQTYREYGVKNEELQVLSALTLGMRQMLDDEVKSWFIHSGSIHVLAVSGLHVGIIFLLVNWLLSLFLTGRSLIKVIVVITVLIFYAILTGGAPSVFRAVVMLSVIQTGIYAQKSGNIYNLLGLSAFIILLVQPVALSHPGFWLSHMAVAGIVTFYPLFHKIYAGRNLFVRSCGDLVAVSLSAQLGTFPLSLFLFRAFPSWFLLSNFFILPLVAPVLVLAKLLVIFSSQSFLASVFSGVLNELLGFMIEVVKWLDSLPFAYVQGLWLGGATMVFFYIVLASLMMWHQFKVRLYFKSALAGTLLILFILNLEYVNKSNADAYVVFDSGRKPLMASIHNGHASLFSDDATTDRQADYLSSGFFSRYALDLRKKSLFSGCDDDFQVEIHPASAGYYIVLGNVNVDRVKIKPQFKNNVQGIILLGDVKGDLEHFIVSLGKPQIILTEACPPWSRKRWLSEIVASGVDIYDVSQSGAYMFLSLPVSIDALRN